MKEYDFAFSIGFCCTCSEALRAEGLQYTSAPFDWIGIDSVLQAPKLIAADFANWFDRDLLDLWDVRILGGFATRVYRNRKTGIGFVHEFSNADPFETCYDRERTKFDRRIARFRQNLESAQRVLVVYMELPDGRRASDDTIAEARRILREKYPGKEIDLLYMYEDPDCLEWKEVSSADGITVARMDYRTFLDGRLMHVCRHDQVRACVRAYGRVPDRRTPEEKAKFAETKLRERRSMLGKGRFERWLNKRLLRWFRDLEAYLERQRIIPGDRPLWFDGDGR